MRVPLMLSLLASAGLWAGQEPAQESAPTSSSTSLEGTCWMGEASTPAFASFIVLEFPADGIDRARLTMPSALALGSEVEVELDSGAPVIRLAAGGRSASLHLEPEPGRIGGRMDVNGPDGTTVLQGFPLELSPWTPPERFSQSTGWIGVLDLPGGNELEFSLRLGHDDDAASARIGVPLQGVSDYPCRARRDGDGWFIETNFGTPVTLTLAPDESEGLTGVMVQSGVEMPARLQPITLEALDRDRRPQTPKPPFPYREIEAVVQHPDGHRLAGTLVLPEGVARPPVAVLITGSGPQDRDESLMGHRPFLVLADHLARNGIATLRCDDRGFGASTGEFSSATTSDFAGDVLAAVAWLRQRDDIDPTAIGLIGHSEGGLVAPMAIAEDPEIAFAVLMAGTGVDGGRVLTSQSERLMEVQGLDRSVIDPIVVLHAELMDLVREEAADEAVAAAFLALTDAQVEASRADLGDEQSDRMRAEVRARLETDPRPLTPWMLEFIRTDPRTYLSRMSCPVLAINGTNDIQVISGLNLPEIERAVTTGGGRIEIIEYPGLNHLFQRSETGSITEYAEIETTIEPEVLRDIADWIGRVTGRDAP